MYEVERDVYDRAEQEPGWAEAGRKREKGSPRQRQRKRATREDPYDLPEEDVRIGVESRRRPAVEEWDRNRGTRTDLAEGKQHQVKAVGIGDLNPADVDRESARLLRSGKPVDIICVDGSKSANKALQHAFNRIPRDHTFILLHGAYWPSSIGLRAEEDREAAALERRYLKMCEQNGRRCKFVNFGFSSNRNFGEKVCQYEKYNNVESIVMGKRAHVSDFRRSLLGSSTQSVMENCSMPVTIVREKEKKALH